MVSQTVYFTHVTGMMVFTLASQMYHIISVLVRVPVHEYKYKYEYYYFGTHEYEYITSTRNSVLEYCEYEYPSPVEDTERTRFCPQTDRRTSLGETSIPPFNFVERG